MKIKYYEYINFNEPKVEKIGNFLKFFHLIHPKTYKPNSHVLIQSEDNLVIQRRIDKIEIIEEFKINEIFTDSTS